VIPLDLTCDRKRGRERERESERESASERGGGRERVGERDEMRAGGSETVATQIHGLRFVCREGVLELSSEPCR